MAHHPNCPKGKDPERRCFCPPNWSESPLAKDPALFELTPETATTIAGTTGKGGLRQQAQRRLELERQSKMRRRYGLGPPETTCKNCKFLKGHGYKRLYFKCAKYGVSSSESTDWRQKWPACGAYEQEPTP